MSVLSKILDFIHGAAVKVSDLFIKLFGKDAAEDFGHDALLILKSDLGKIATKVVAEVAKVYSGSEAKEAAFQQIKDEAFRVGIEAKDSVINLLIELAVNSILKGNFLPA
jgi:hypothetical protein